MIPRRITTGAIGAFLLTLGLALGGALAGDPSSFDGQPTAPQQFHGHGDYAHYDVQRHIRDISDWNAMQSMNAQHGANCSGPPDSHAITAYEDMVFICNDHVMTSLNAPSYGVIYLTKDELLDWSNGPAEVTFDMSTERMSTRDWPDWWLTPWEDNLALPFNQGDVDLDGKPRNNIHIDTNNSQGSPFLQYTTNGTTVHRGPAGYDPSHYGADITPGTNEAAVRQSFRIRIWETTVCPVGCDYTPTTEWPTGEYTDVMFERLASATATYKRMIWDSIPRTTWTQAVVQIGHHSYTPTKDGAGVPATWHWDNVKLNPSVPFTIAHAQERFVEHGQTVHFPAAPANAFLRFSAIGTVSVNGNVVARQWATEQNGRPNTFSSYFVPIAEGATQATLTFAANSWYTGPYRAKDFHVWSMSTAQATPTPTPPPPTATPPPPTATPTPTATATATEVPPTATNTPLPPTATPEPPTSTPTAVPPTATATPTGTPAPDVCELAHFTNGQEDYRVEVPCL